MLSSGILQELDRLHKAQSSYRPNAEIAAQLSAKTILLFVGATCVGKNTIMEGIATRDTRFRIVGTFTSREPRSDDKAYTYYENSDAGLKPILGAIKRHHVVQYAVNPFAHTLYGSSPNDYSGNFPMADVFSSAVEQFRQLGFKHVQAITVVTEATAWLRRFNERFPSGHPQRRARRDEAIESLHWSLAQTPGNHAWAVNIDGHPEVAITSVMNAVTAKHGGDARGPEMAKAIIQAAEGMQV